MVALERGGGGKHGDGGAVTKWSPERPRRRRAAAAHGGERRGDEPERGDNGEGGPEDRVLTTKMMAQTSRLEEAGVDGMIHGGA